MNPRLALQIVCAVSLFGACFSGTLTWQELFDTNALSCPAPGTPGTVFGYPACVYGFFMYLVLSGVSGLGLWGLRRSAPRPPLGGMAGGAASG